MSKFGGGGAKCKICNKTSYPAETIQFEKVPYHADCFRCKSCDKKMENASKAQAFEEEIYCTKCFSREGFAQKQKKVTWTKKETTSSAVASKFGGGGNPCTICSKTVYTAEALSFEKKIYHAACFACSLCEKKMTQSSAASFEDQIICTKCFKDNGYAQKQTKQTRTPSTTKTTNALASRFGGGGTKCVVCSKTVYNAELLSYEKNAFHQGCFNCKNCGKNLTPSGCEGKKLPDGGVDTYCKKCWAELGLNRAKVN